MTEEEAYEKGLKDGLKNGCLLHDTIIKQQTKTIGECYQVINKLSLCGICISRGIENDAIKFILKWFKNPNPQKGVNNGNKEQSSSEGKGTVS